MILTPGAGWGPSAGRGRRLASGFADLLILVLPLSPIVGVDNGSHGDALAASIALGCFGAVVTVTTVVLQIVLLVRHGRTLGMALTGLVAEPRGRDASVLVTFLWPVVFYGVTAVAMYAIGKVVDIDDDTETLIAWLCPVGALVLNFVVLVGRRRRTLIDVLSERRVVRDTTPHYASMRGPGKARLIDAFLLVACGAPVILGAGGYVGVMVIAAIALAIVGTAEVILWRSDGTTLGMRAVGMGSSPPPC
jgi:hypothetical protein